MVSIKRIVFLLSLLCGFVASAQQAELGIPYYETYSPFFVGYEGPWNGIVQDDENILYFENTSGVVSFDGTEWNLFPTHGMPKLYQNKNGEIYVAATNYIGKINVEDNKRRSLRSILKDSTYTFGSVSDMVECDNKFYFVAQNKLYSVADGVPVKTDVDVVVKEIFVNRNVLYIATDNSLYEYGKYLKMLIQVPVAVLDVLRTDGFFVYATSTGFMKITPDNSFSPFLTEIDEYIKKGDFSCFAKLTNNTICVGTKSHGLFCIDADGKIIFTLDVSKGFPDNKIRGVFVDKNNSVWVTTNSEITRVEMNSAITYFNKYNGLYGNVKSVIRHKGVLYAGSDQGVFKLNASSFEKIAAYSCNKLVIGQGDLLAATENGLFNLSKPGFPQISPNPIKNTFSTEGKLLSISDSWVLAWLQTAESNLQMYKIPKPEIEITSIACEKSKDCLIFLGTKNDGVWILEQDSTQQINLKKCDWQGLPKNSDRVEVFETALGCVFSTSQGLYRCEPENHFFYKDAKILVSTDDEQKAMLIAPIKEDKEKNLWMAFHREGVYENQIAVAWNTNNSEHYTLITAPFMKVRKNHTTTILTDDNYVVWLGGLSGLVRMDFNKMSVKKTIENVRLARVLLNNDSLLSQKDEIVLPYNMKSITFEFSSVEFENHDDVFYSFYLEGQEKMWSSATQITKKEYTNLPAGRYVFHVRAKRLGGAVSKETTYSFEVKSNPLLSIWAMGFYIILLSLIIIAICEREKKSIKKRYENKTTKEEVSSDEPVQHKEEKDFLLNDGISEEGIKEIQSTGRVHSMTFDLATVLFSDFKGFTKIAERVSAESLIQELDKYFSEFDKIVEKYNVEKIKTVGDSYMCAGGIPKKNSTNPIEVVAAALEMQYRLSEMQRDSQDGETWGVRIGIHTGPIIAGVAGGRKLSYDIWGDTVNIADDLETAGEVGRVNVSESTFLMIQEFFDCEYRGKVALKGHEEKIDMYFVNGFKAQFTENPLKALPNQEFTYKLALLRFESLQERMYTVYEENLPKVYFYHNLKHTIDVVVQVEAIGQVEGVNDEDMFILKTAALFHDAGFMRTYQKHELASIEIAKETLTKENYTLEQIAKVCRLIECTIMTEEPQNLLEEIIRDADLDYLGRNDYLCVSNELYKELLEQNLIKKNEYEWYVGQIKFLQEHKYYTNYSRSRRNPEKVKHIQWLQEQITKFNNIN